MDYLIVGSSHSCLPQVGMLLSEVLEPSGDLLVPHLPGPFQAKVSVTRASNANTCNCLFICGLLFCSPTLVNWIALNSRFSAVGYFLPATIFGNLNVTALINQPWAEIDEVTQCQASFTMGSFACAWSTSADWYLCRAISVKSTFALF